MNRSKGSHKLLFANFVASPHEARIAARDEFCQKVFSLAQSLIVTDYGIWISAVAFDTPRLALLDARDALSHIREWSPGPVDKATRAVEELLNFISVCSETEGHFSTAQLSSVGLLLLDPTEALISRPSTQHAMLLYLRAFGAKQLGDTEKFRMAVDAMKQASTGKLGTVYSARLWQTLGELARRGGLPQYEREYDARTCYRNALKAADSLRETEDYPRYHAYAATLNLWFTAVEEAAWSEAAEHWDTLWRVWPDVCSDDLPTDSELPRHSMLLAASGKIRADEVRKLVEVFELGLELVSPTEARQREVEEALKSLHACKFESA